MSSRHINTHMTITLTNIISSYHVWILPPRRRRYPNKSPTHSYLREEQPTHGTHIILPLKRRGYSTHFRTSSPLILGWKTWHFVGSIFNHTLWQMMTFHNDLSQPTRPLILGCLILSNFIRPCQWKDVSCKALDPSCIACTLFPYWCTFDIPFW